ncbi:hypothetical protein GWK08_00330 [Leptobacterium flavescens]|uniref:Transcription regulator PadR N-terminal domain-containing protein n=1 Tax=Leptobacterium flavescens TaxID=472055 RepID=A0A6P0UF54_9FLAO|nr:PadR family transcriptional regulator [Leptobacterium flavescens]NER11875.1 hypothetical protein [Leptobacterium flavescens]
MENSSIYGLTLQQIKILHVIETEEKYGYQIMKELDNKILLGSLYNSLKAMEKKGYVESKWGEDDNKGGRRKYYRITPGGVRVLEYVRADLISQFNLA